MSRIPNPFLCGEMQPKQPQTPSGPGFLMMTRPPSGSNSYGGRGGRSGSMTPQRHQFNPLTPTGNFIPFSAASHSSHDRRGRHSQGGGGGGGGHRGSPRVFTPYQSSPYQHSPVRGAGGSMGYPGGVQGMPFTPSRQSGNRDSYGSHGNPRQNRYSYNGSSRGGRDHHGPISDIPVEKFVSPSMVKDPWAEFDVPATTFPTSIPLQGTSSVPSLNVSEIVIDSDASVVIENEGGGGIVSDIPITATASTSLKRTSTVPLLDNSEIIIDSDTSSVVVLEDSYDGGVSGTEGDSSPVPDTGSESPYVVTSSTSDKDVGSDSTGDD